MHISILRDSNYEINSFRATFGIRLEVHMESSLQKHHHLGCAKCAHAAPDPHLKSWLLWKVSAFLLEITW